MPSTVNGIGTHYYGKKNGSVRTAACGSCHRVGRLESYDTRLWFVIVFIPVIPLGRKRIIDKCPTCTRHVAADADAYEQARQLQTSGSLERFRREPSPEAALQVHGTLLAFHDHEQSDEFRRSALERYPDHAGLRAGLASQLEQVSVFDKSGELWESALALDPDLTEARVGVARRRMGQGELDEARDLLDFLETPGAGEHENLGPLDVLSTYYQNQGRHDEALAISEHLLREIPQAGRQHTFRAFVRKSEKALGRTESILPPVEHSLRGLFRAEGSPYPAWLRRLVAGVAVVGLLAAGLLVNNEYTRRNRLLHVVNACGRPVEVRIDGGPSQTVSGLGRLAVSEGRHRVRVTGPVDETHDVDLKADFFGRWFSRPLWVVNPGGEAVLQDSTVYYAANPRPSSHRLILGKPFVEFPHVDYPFDEPPESLPARKDSAPVEKTAVRWLQGVDVPAFQATLPTDRLSALSFAERRLRRDPGQRAMLVNYVGHAGLEDGARVEAFLKSGLGLRPVSVQWHRAYQTSAEINGHGGDLAALYDGFLAADPKNAALLYLRGRFDLDWDRQEAFFRRAAAADPGLPWPWFALAVNASSQARWAESLDFLRKAREAKIDEEEVKERVHVARIATGEAETLVTEDRARLASNPVDPETMLFLCDALAASGQADKVMPEVAGWLNRLAAPIRAQVDAPIRAMALYAAGQAEECEQHCRNVETLRQSPIRLEALAALGRAGEANDPSFEKAGDDPWTALAVSLSLSLDGKADDAARWRDRASRKLASLTRGLRLVAGLLDSKEPPAVADLDRMTVDAQNKALLYAVLAARFPAKRAEYLASASRFNVRRVPPYLLVRRATGAEAPAPP